MPITNQEKWDSYTEKNKDAFGGCCVKIAGRVMELLETKYPKGLNAMAVDKLISRAETEVGESGITGFMAGAIAHMVSTCHSRGREFQKAWNISCGLAPKEAEDSEGTVNPAILIIKQKEA